MWNYFKEVYHRYFAGIESGAALFIFLLFGIFIYYLGDYLMPLFAAIFIAFLLNEPVRLLHKRGVPNKLAAVITFLLFLVIGSVIILMFLPLFWGQAINFVRVFPGTVEQVGSWLSLLPERYPDLFNRSDIDSFIGNLRNSLIGYGQAFLSSSLDSITRIAGNLAYLVIILFLAFFILMDYEKLSRSVANLVPAKNQLMLRLGQEMKAEMLRYIGGKLLEGVIVFACSWIVYTAFGLEFSFILGLLTGISVIIPYVGAVLVSVPVALVAYDQFGPANTFYYILLAYIILQVLDGYVLVPLLFSEIVNLHPVSVIAAILLFGGLWGLWGVAFAIPLATFIKVLIRCWPQQEVPEP